MTLTRLMYVDDEADIRTIVEMSLTMVGDFEVTMCASGKEALEQLSQARPQLLLLDVMMPGMDGPSTLEAVRQVPGFEAIPVVFVTAKVQPEEVAGFRALGAADVIAKPFDPMSLSAEVQAIWDRLAED